MDPLNDLKTATAQLKEAHVEVARQREALADAQHNLAYAERNHILDGLEGKNETERKARLAQLTQEQTTALEGAEYALRLAELNLKLADLDYKLAREALSLHRAELLTRAPLEAVA